MMNGWNVRLRNNRNQITGGTSFSIARHSSRHLIRFRPCFWAICANIYRTHTFDVSAWLPHKSPKSCSKSIKTHKMRMIFSEKAIGKRFQRWIALILNAYAYIIASLVRGNATFTRNWKRHIRRATNPFAYKTYRQSSGWEQIPIAVKQMIYSFDSGSIRLACAKNDFIIITPLAESNTHTQTQSFHFSRNSI